MPRSTSDPSSVRRTSLTAAMSMFNRASFLASKYVWGRSVFPQTCAALIRREERLSSLTHPRLTASFTTRPREEEEALLKKSDRTDLIRFRCGHHPHLRRWQHMTGMSETDSCRLCAEEEESSKQLWLRCPAFIVERQRLGLGRTFEELVRLPCASLVLLRIIFWRLR